jgi:hypothetical protein
MEEVFMVAEVDLSVLRPYTWDDIRRYAAFLRREGEIGLAEEVERAAQRENWAARPLISW